MGFNHKKVTASKEVWAEYLKAHPKFKKFRDETFEEFDDLKLIFDKNIATGTNAIGLGETTDAQTVRVAEETEKKQAKCGEEFSFDVQQTMNRNHLFFAILQTIL
ncbi:hypothetical protein HID58_037124 [Brassica napus]|uniref:Uncharacterized protein n=1 Tax=Brassica napus TaxID=3708 RepID=A0ABQ7XFV1_BRANA|nr:hypothetical protein HID58_037124 [Brassica napus]